METEDIPQLLEDILNDPPDEESPSSLDIEGGWNSRKLKLKDYFELNLQAKRKYAAEASRKTREKKKRERAELVERNSMLEQEQKDFKLQVCALKEEIEMLEAANQHSETNAAALAVENQLLKIEVKRRREVFQRIKQVIEEIPEEEQKSLLSLASISARISVIQVLELCRLSAQNQRGTWRTLAYNASEDVYLQACEYLSSAKNVNAQFEHVLTATEANRVNIRIDFIDLEVDENVMATALWKVRLSTLFAYLIFFWQFESRKDNLSMFKLAGQIAKESGGIEVVVSELDLSFGNLSLKDLETKKNTQFYRQMKSHSRREECYTADGQRRVLLNSVADATLLKNKADPLSSGKVFVVSSGIEKINPLDFKFEQNLNKREDAFIVTNSVIQAEITDSRTAAEVNQECTFFTGYIVTNFTGERGRCNLSVSTTVVQDFDLLHSFLYGKFIAFEHNIQQKYTPLLSRVIAQGVDAAIREVLRESKHSMDS